MTEHLYLTRHKIGQVLTVSERKARTILEQHGVKPVDLGRGRGNGLRWRTSAVIQVADTLHAEAQQQNAKSARRPAKMRPIRGRSASELFAEFNREQPIQ